MMMEKGGLCCVVESSGVAFDDRWFTLVTLPAGPVSWSSNVDTDAKIPKPPKYPATSTTQSGTSRSIAGNTDEYKQHCSWMERNPESSAPAIMSIQSVLQSIC